MHQMTDNIPVKADITGKHSASDFNGNCTLKLLFNYEKYNGFLSNF